MALITEPAKTTFAFSPGWLLFPVLTVSIYLTRWTEVRDLECTQSVYLDQSENSVWHNRFGQNGCHENIADSPFIANLF